MRFVVAVCALVCSLGTLGLAAENTEFKPFAPKDGGFTISFPGKPEESTNTTSTDLGSVVIHELAVKRPKEKETFVLIYSDLPGEMVKGADPETVLNRARDGGAASVHAKPAKETKIELDGNPGRELEVAGLGGTRLWRLYLVDGRLYQLLVTTESGKPSPERAKTFFNSFKPVKTASTAPTAPSAVAVPKE
ncbi:MAG TPA: hypothetical protein VHX65_15685 [Pirellulales bacterium]|jgi:hypothetical protein|nr:hypothetical protein [Pirellulales bacterium]